MLEANLRHSAVVPFSHFQFGSVPEDGGGFVEQQAAGTPGQILQLDYPDGRGQSIEEAHLQIWNRSAHELGNCSRKRATQTAVGGVRVQSEAIVF